MVISRWSFVLQAACLVSGCVWLTPSPREARGPDAQLGAFHILSQFFLFARYETYPYEPSDPERGLSKLLQENWGRFTSGDPNGSGTPKWEPYKPSRDPVMLLDLHPVLARDLRPDECNFWDRSGS